MNPSFEIPALADGDPVVPDVVGGVDMMLSHSRIVVCFPRPPVSKVRRSGHRAYPGARFSAIETRAIDACIFATVAVAILLGMRSIVFKIVGLRPGKFGIGACSALLSAHECNAAKRYTELPIVTIPGDQHRTGGMRMIEHNFDRVTSAC